MREPDASITGAESIAVTLAATPALIVVVAYLADRVGVSFTPPLMLATAFLSGIAMLLGYGRRAFWDATETATFAGIVSVTFAWLLWIARPTFFPLGSGPDLTHHLLLIHYIETHWTLVRDGAAQEFLGEMVQYTPGSHILTALAGAWSRSNGLHALHAVMAASVALKSGFVFLIALRVLPQDVPRVPLAAVGSISLFASQLYFLGSFAQYSFLAQVIAECFTVAMWWALTAWWQTEKRWWMPLAGAFGAAIFLTWPILIGPPLVLLAVLVILPAPRPPAAVLKPVQRPDATYVSELWRKVVDATIAIAPIAVVAVLFSIGRVHYVEIAGTGGEAAEPMVRAYGWTFLTLSTAGIVIAAIRSRSRTVAIFALAILLQAAGLYVFAQARGNNPYMMRKMFYMLLCPQGVGVAVAIAGGWSLIHSSAKAYERRMAWAAVVISAIFVARPLVGAPKSLAVAKHPATSLQLEQAANWVLGHANPRCVEYLVGDDNTAYWLHLAMLGNPRRGARTGDNATYELNPALVRWLTPGGLPYAIADLPVVPTDIKTGSDIVAQFGTAAVLKRRGPSMCADQRP